MRAQVLDWFRVHRENALRSDAHYAAETAAITNYGGAGPAAELQCSAANTIEVTTLKLLLLNGLVIILVASPLVLLEVLRSRSRWIEEHHGGLSLALWFLTLAAVYIWVLPYLALQPNPRFFEP